MPDLDYTTIDRPYSSSLNRTSETPVPLSGTVNPSDYNQNQGENTVETGKTLNDIIISTWIKSRNYLPRKQGFIIDGRTGNIEAMNGFFSGSIEASSIDIGGSDATSFHVDVDGNMWLGAGTFAAAIAKISNAGVGTFSNITITGGSVATSTLSGLVALSNINIAAQGWTQTSAFSSTDLDTVSWGVGTFTTAGGTSYAIGAGNTGNMAARTYIYLDIAVSIIAYQVTTTATTAVGSGKVLVATAINGATEAEFEVFGGIGGLKILATNAIVANSITAALMNVSQLSAISANIGTITAGSITVVTGGNTVALTPGSATAIAAGPTGSPTFTVTQSGVVTMSGAIITGSNVGNLQIFTANGIWTKPAGASLVVVVVIAGGGGGGGGQNAGSFGGGTGGGGGAVIQKVFKASDLSATVAITIGAGGAAGAVGGDASGGATSSFGSYISAYGGNGGIRGQGGTYSGGGGGGWAGAGQLGQVGASSLGGSTAITAGSNGLSGQGAGSAVTSDGKSAEWGGGSGGGQGTPGPAGGSSLFGAPGGGSGATTPGPGGAGGNIQSYSAGGGGAGGAGGVGGSGNGGAGTAGTNGDIGTGGGGGGSGGTSGTGGAGGAGGVPGAGGGGGGGGNLGAVGADGARGEIRIYSV